MGLQPGDTLDRGRHRIVRLLGRGGYGFVYLADDTLLHEQVAIKELIPALVGDDVVLKRFLAEAKATMRLTHERIVRTHNVFSEGGNYYIVMEYMAGGSLEARLQARPALPADEALRVASDVAEGLAYAHQHGVVHCDLKPANVLFTGDGRAKVADFGIAHVSDQMLSRSWVTPTGFAAGTLPYMSPEQADGVRDDPRVDVYALGAVLYRMLTGQLYLDFDQRDTPGAQARNVGRILSEMPQPPSERNRGVPPWLDAAVLRALSKQPIARYASVAEMRAVLLGQEQPGSAGRREEPEPTVPISTARPGRSGARPSRSAPPPTRRRRPAWLWPSIASGGVLLAVAVAVLLWREPAPRGSVARAGATASPAPGLTRGASATPAQAAGLPPTESAPDSLPSPSATLRPGVQLAPTSTRPPTATPRPAPTPVPTATPTRTPIPVPMFTVERAEVNARSGPGTSYPVVGTLRQGEAYEVTGQNEAGDWWQFPYAGSPAWVSASVVRGTDQARTAPVVIAPPPPSPTPSPTQAQCTGQPGSSFLRLWDRDRMGCPVGAETGIVTAYQPFERGWMLWRMDNNNHYALLSDGTHAAFNYSPWEPPEFWCSEAQVRGEPRRGFSRVWCENLTIRDRIGGATGPEVGDYRPVQEFESGFMIFVGERDAVVSVYRDGTWVERR